MPPSEAEQIITWLERQGRIGFAFATIIRRGEHLETPSKLWQPIETAPKDATAVLVMRDIWPGIKGGRATECNGHNTYVAQWWGEENDGGGAWVCYMDAIQDPQCPVEPTHWMPLPPPPMKES